MKKKIFITIISVAIFSSRVKQKNCDCNMEGKFVYLKEPYKEKTNMGEFKVIANFDSYQIYGHIPKKYRKTDTVLVSICLEDMYKGGFRTHDISPIVYSVKCIEEIKE